MQQNRPAGVGARASRSCTLVMAQLSMPWFNRIGSMVTTCAAPTAILMVSVPCAVAAPGIASLDAAAPAGTSRLVMWTMFVFCRRVLAPAFGDPVAGDLLDAVDTHVANVAAKFGAQQVDGMLHAALAGDGGGVVEGPADEDEFCAER
jgi:hypothetical protein